MEIVRVSSPVLGAQFTPFLQAIVVRDPDFTGETVLIGIDPLDANPDLNLSEPWEVTQIRH